MGFVIRVAVCFMLILALFLVGSVRIMVINSSEALSALQSENVTVVTVSDIRGNIYDCNGNPLTGAVYKNYVVITPCPETVMLCSTVFNGAQKDAILAELQQGKPAVAQVKEELICRGIINLKVPVRNQNGEFCAHLLGYTDATGHGVCGIEKAYDNALYTGKKISVKYACSATGEILGGIEPIIEQSSEALNSGVMLTIDSNVQAVAENAAQKLPRGAVAISEVGTGKIRGMVSRPNYDINNVKDYLQGEYSPLLNRAISGYNAGSVFKPCVAAAILENKKGRYLEFECSGGFNVEDRFLKCHLSIGHGTVGMRDAIINSCNSYFYGISPIVGGENIINIASVFGFGYSKRLCDGIATSGEKMPTVKVVQNPLNLANLSIGQGELMASPITFLALYEAIANGGIYHKPTVLEGEMKNGEAVANRQESRKVRAVSEQTANTVKQYLCDVVISGTGKNAYSESVKIAGKTATAQTGWKENGREIQHSWFCGFFPAENPRYVMAVLVEDSMDRENLAAEIFKEIAEALTDMQEGFN